ncbi:4'-phosphopantetheinyl transferase superfamily protein [Microbulbifer bruguierae]|uniref:4'-phosphopantetheinyl transferase superfamily protein n=1 Tax=Microbulbifer bruguierae TaxID=3029061 RepID=A0ABY8NHQ6_9GAMM|nr:4'-phosphopantetheinyl transferase superfamily protein [Microbulbifer bruguierae]WGL18465.1 4'-phosphopantetheinyl transferase superfamily protein [Microbulbifer bruguierae]
MILPAVWLLRVDDVSEGSAEARALETLLSDDELARRARYHNSAARHQFTLGRALLRRVLGQVSGQAPQGLIFSRNHSGKPLLTSVPDLHFSLSHSGEWLALAVSCKADIGVDIEQPRKPRDFMRIARHYFHPDECALLASPPAELTPMHFYRLWTMKEAFFKARGTGISEGLARINLAGFHLGQGISFADDLADSDKPWQFHYGMFALPDTAQLHLAVAGTDPGIVELNQDTFHRGLDF